MLTRRLGGLAEMALQRGVEHVLHERALARARYTGNAHQVPQRKLHRHVLEVVVAHAFEDEARRGLAHQALDAHADVLAPAEVGAGERVGRADGLGRAVEDDLTAAFAGAWAHVDQSVGREHHRRIVLDHHQRVARIAQALHGLDDAVHVARVEADARFVEHEHGVHERGAERGGEVDALHLAAAERSALAVEREVADAHVAQVAQARADLVEQQLQRFVEHGAGQGDAVEEAADALDGHQHQVVHRQPGQRLELVARPRHAGWHDAGAGRHRAIGIRLRAQAPQQRLGLEPRAAADMAGRVAAVLGQEHTDVHLVGLRLEVLEEALDAVPLLVPLAGPVGRAVDHPVALCLGECHPGGVTRNAGLAGVLHQVVLAFLPGRCLQGLDGTVAQRLARVGNHQPVVDADHPAEAAAGVAGTVGGVEAEQRRLRIGIADVAVRAVQAGGKTPEVGLAFGFQRVHVHTDRCRA